MTEAQGIGFMLLLFGGLSIVRPDLYMEFKKWTGKMFLDVEYKWSKKTLTIVQAIGVLFIILGLLAITGAIS